MDYFITKRASVPDYAYKIFVFHYCLESSAGIYSQAAVLHPETHQWVQVAWLKDRGENWNLRELEPAQQDFEDYYVNLGYAVYTNR